jgi:hypothetical protein
MPRRQVAEPEVDEMWEGLTSAVAGLLASLNKLDRTTGAAPRSVHTAVQCSAVQDPSPGTPSTLTAS